MELDLILVILVILIRPCIITKDTMGTILILIVLSPYILPMEEILNSDMITVYEPYIRDFNVILFWILPFTGIFDICQLVVSYDMRRKIGEIFTAFLVPLLISFMYTILWSVFTYTTLNSIRLNLSIIITLIIIRKLPSSYKEGCIVDVPDESTVSKKKQLKIKKLKIN